MNVFEIDYLSIEARGYAHEQYGNLKQHHIAFVRAATIEEAISAVHDAFPAKFGPNFDFGEVWSIKRHPTANLIDLEP